MASVTQPLREEHKELFPHVESLCAAADAVGAASPEGLRQALEEAVGFLTGHLIPHAKAEEAALYPVVGRVMGAEKATATMSRDHVEVGRLTDELVALNARLGGQPPTSLEARDLRRLLYGLYAMVKLHFAKEEEVYLPLLDEKLSPEDARKMFEAMEAAAARAKAGVA